MVVRLRGNRENVSRNNCIVRRFVTSGPYLTIRAVLWRAPLRDPLAGHCSYSQQALPAGAETAAERLTNPAI